MRLQQVDGRTYLLAPLTLLVPGVLSGSNGPVYYPQKEIARNASDWNGIPLTLDHPKDGKGRHISAEHVLEEYWLGYVENAKIRNGKLVAEGWFDIERVKEMSPTLFLDLQAGRKVELSTGLFHSPEQAPPNSSFNGRAYRAIARNMSPDHLAILVDALGACSIQDGCGVFNHVRK